MSFSEYIGKKLTGKQVNQLLKGVPLIKFMNDDDNNDGIYVTTLDNFHCWIDNYGEYVRYVTLPDDARVYIEDMKMKCDKLILSEIKSKKYFLSDMFEQKMISYGQMLELVKKNEYALVYIDQKYRTNEMMMCAVKKNGHVLHHIDQQFRTNDMMIEAVKQNGLALRYINQEFRTNDMMIEAVKQNRYALLYIVFEFFNVAIVEQAVKTDDGLQFIRDRLQTYETLWKYLDESSYHRGVIKQNIETYRAMLNEVLKRMEKEKNKAIINQIKGCFGFADKVNAINK